MVNTEDEVVDVNDRSGNAAASASYLQVACKLRDRLRDGRPGDSSLMEILQSAAREFGIEPEAESVEGRNEPGGEGMRGPDVAMTPNLWGGPSCVPFQIMLAYLPLRDIRRLRILNKEWKQTLEMADCKFYNACEELGRKKLCLITRSEDLFWARVLDMRSREWFTYPIDVGPSMREHLKGSACVMAVGEDAGLVCFATCLNSKSKNKNAPRSLLISVVNPLTMIVKELPTLLDVWELKLVQLKMDGGTKAFKVFVVADKATWRKRWISADDVQLQIFDSQTGAWTVGDDTSYLLFGHKKWHGDHDFAYDSADGGRVLDLSSPELRAWGERASFARSKDRVFALRMGEDGPANRELQIRSPTVWIEEFRFERQEGGLSWLKVETHRCNPFERLPRKPTSAYIMQVHACDGYLVVLAALDPGPEQENPCKRRDAHERLRGKNRSIRFNNQLAWLYDLSTRNWSTLDLPLLPVGRRTYSENGKELIVELRGGLQRRMKYDGDTHTVDVMCELHWTT
jgi:hypothetical protein